MKIRVGNMWDHYDEYHVVLVTANSSLNSKGELIMGLGAAKWVKDHYPNAPKRFGERIMLQGQYCRYGVEMVHHEDVGKTSLFQTKIEFQKDSKLELVAFSTGMLTAMIGMTEAIGLPRMQFALNFPGIGLGGLYVGDVYPIIKPLPNNVDVWMFTDDYQELLESKVL